MDPWLERHWGDVHQSLITYTRDHLQDALPAGLLARMQERVFVEFPDANPVTEGFIEILDTGSQGRVVTVIEILSLANKQQGMGQELYVRKQRECAEAGVSLVEIDLLRAGKRVTNAPPEILPVSHRTAYQACVLRGSKSDVAEVYRISLRDRLPVIGIPLRPADPDALLNLQLLIDLAYRRGRYDLSIDYKSDPHPPLIAEDAAWAEELLKTRSQI